MNVMVNANCKDCFYTIEEIALFIYIKSVNKIIKTFTNHYVD